jgi:flagellar hook-length control protein FliK
MNPGLSAIDMMVAGPLNVCPASPNPPSPWNAKRTSANSPDDSSSIAASQSTKFKDALTDIQRSPTETPHGSGETLRDGAAAQVLRKNQDNTEPDAGGRGLLAFQIADATSFVASNASAIANTGDGKDANQKTDTLALQQTGPKTSNRPLQFIDTFSLSKTPAVSKAVAAVDIGESAVPTSFPPLAETSQGLQSVPAGPKPNTSVTSAADKITALDNAKPPVFAVGVLAGAEDNLTVLTAAVLAGSEKSTSAVRKPADNGAPNRKTGILPDSSDGSGKKGVANPLTDSAVQKLNVTEVCLSANQTAAPQKSASADGTDFAQIFSPGDTRPAVAHSSSASAAINNPADAACPDDVSADVRKQIFESIHTFVSRNERQVTIRLNPPELGKVFIKFQEQDAQLTGLLEVSNSRTRFEIEQTLPQIIRDLQDSGIQIKRLDVVLAEQTDHRSPADQSPPDSWLHQHGFTEPGAVNGGKSDGLWSANDADCRNGLSPQAQITDSSINILV